MELPRNITQIGESDRSCKVYVEDYVVSYIKQMNHLAQNKDMAVALYGTRKEENEISYVFLYGACKLDYLNSEVRHLSQAQNQEIERLRKKYFPDYTFLGYRLLNGEMIEGMHICEQGICRYIKGYACFYEKNDSMLAYMIDARGEETKPEEVPQEKYEEVKQRQEERRIQYEEKAAPTKTLKMMRASVAGMFVLLGVAGLAALGGGEQLEDLQVAAREIVAEFSEQKIPDQEVVEGTGLEQTDTLVAEGKLTEALLQENTEAPAQNGQEQQGTAGQANQEQAAENQAVTGQDNQEQATGNQTVTEQAIQEPAMTEQTVTGEQATAEQAAAEEQTVVTEQTAAAEQTASTGQTTVSEQTTTEQVNTEQQTEIQEAASPTAYIIKEGDTLIGICIRSYGSDARIEEICQLNDITNPDNIKIGQKILLP